MSATAFDPFEKKTDISASSRKLYTFNLRKLNDGKEVKNLNFLSKPEIITKLEALTPNTRRTYIIAVVSSLKDRPEAKYKKLYNKYYKMLVDINADLKNNTTKSETQKENWISQEEVMKKCNDLGEIVAEIKGRRKISEEQYTQLLHAVVLGLYCLQPPRRNSDYTKCLVVKKIPEDNEYNYLDIKNWDWIFNNYKTKKTYKQVKMPVPEELVKLLKVYFQYHPHAKAMKQKSFEPFPFLMTQDGKVIDTSTEMTRTLNKIFGKKIGSSLLRNIFLTDKYSDNAKEMADDVKAMGTSSNTATHNYIKTD
tara:strand:- start:198 stop:1124 length:927 start_codon:yes stop_codon:yes gene_type:complete